MKVVVDTSVLIALSNISRLELLRSLFNEVIVPEAVAREYGEPLPSWVKVVAVKNRELVNALRETLGEGEAEAIALAMEVKADLVILDDKKARNTARRMGLRVTGTLGVLLFAKKLGLIEDLQSEVRRLVETGFYLARDVVSRVLEEARKDC